MKTHGRVLMPDSSASVTFKIGDLGVSRLEYEIRHFRPSIPWMVAPEVLNSAEFGMVGKQTDIYHAGLVLLAVATGITPSFAPEEIVQGVPQATAEKLPPPLGPAIGEALRRHVHGRTQTAFQFWQRLSLR
jgi:serine/threonine protein kinase